MSAKFLYTLDTEIAWGIFYRKYFKDYYHHFDCYRPNVARLLKLMNMYSIKATWAFVGHLFLEKCDGIHEEILRPKYSWFNHEDWHKFDPGTNLENAPYWYGRDILDKVTNITPKQEIAAHTFSHVLMADKECTADIAKSQVKACIELGKELNVVIETLVFPRDEVAYLKEIAGQGIKTFRGPEQTWYANTPLKIMKFLHIIDQFLGITPPVYRISELAFDYEILNVPASQFLIPYDGFRKYISSSSRLKKAKKGVNMAIKKGAVFHLWHHTFNLGSSERFFYILAEIFKYVDKKRQDGKIENCTMKEIYQLYSQKQKKAPADAK